MAKEVGYNAKLHITKLSQIFISKANCKQRSGRAGRVREGVCYHLVSRAIYERFVNLQWCFFLTFLDGSSSTGDFEITA